MDPEYRDHGVVRTYAGKRALDVVLAAAAGVLLSPVALVTALAIRARMGRPVVFRQLRGGALDRPFALYKFRTMHDVRDAEGHSCRMSSGWGAWAGSSAAPAWTSCPSW